MKGKIHKEKRKKEYVCHPYNHICDDRTKEKGKRMDKKKKNLSHPNTSFPTTDERSICSSTKKKTMRKIDDKQKTETKTRTKIEKQNLNKSKKDKTHKEK